MCSIMRWVLFRSRREMSLVGKWHDVRVLSFDIICCHLWSFDVKLSINHILMPADIICRGVRHPRPMMHTAYSTLFAKIYKFLPISKKFIHSPSVSAKFTFFCLIYFFASPLFWPWCIYASCFTRTGRPWSFDGPFSIQSVTVPSTVPKFIALPKRILHLSPSSPPTYSSLIFVLSFQLPTNAFIFPCTYDILFYLSLNERCSFTRWRRNSRVIIRER